MGVGSSSLEKELGEDYPPGEKFFGYHNFGNTCYCNSVLQALYFCEPFREHILDYRRRHDAFAEAMGESHPLDVQAREGTLLFALSDLYRYIATQKKRTGVIAPRRFISKLRRVNELFRGAMHQDAHEFQNYLLNTVAETLQEDLRMQTHNLIPNARSFHEGKDFLFPSLSSISFFPFPPSHFLLIHGVFLQSGNFLLTKRWWRTMWVISDVVWTTDPFDGKEDRTFVHDLFEGILVNETRCLCCENLTERDESFLDLSLDVEPNISISHCLRNFSSIETLRGSDKFYCDHCCSLQEAQKRMRIKKLPQVLVVHLKRFKYSEVYQSMTKLIHRVPFPFELKLLNTTEDAEDADRPYELFAVVMHVGVGGEVGHYVCAVKNTDLWFLFDDEQIKIVEPFQIQGFFGMFRERLSTNTGCGYVLFYRSVPIDERV